MMMSSSSSVVGSLSRRFIASRTKLASTFSSMPLPQEELEDEYVDPVVVTSTKSSSSSPRVWGEVRTDWSLEEVGEVYRLPFHELMYRASVVHRANWDASMVQQCTLLSIKTGGCTEDCKYCSQSARHKKVTLKPTPTLSVETVMETARRAKEAGSTRFCMGAAWREMGGKDRTFGKILEMVRGVRALGMEACCTLGMINEEQARQLKDAGLTAYNHNLDTSPEYYPSVITTRTYQDRLDTLRRVRDAGIGVCCGGILGLGEAESDRVSLLHVLATMPQHPDSVPINALVAIEGTPLGDKDDLKPVDAFDVTRAIAAARIVMPRTVVRLSAGRLGFSEAEQFMMFHAGANSIFHGDKLLTAPNPDVDEDGILFRKLGYVAKPPTHDGSFPDARTQHNEVAVEQYTADVRVERYTHVA